MDFLLKDFDINWILAPLFILNLSALFFLWRTNNLSVMDKITYSIVVLLLPIIGPVIGFFKLYLTKKEKPVSA